MSASFECRQAQIVLEGTALTGVLECATQARRVALVGPWQPWFTLAAGRARLARGSVEVYGVPLRQALREGVLGLVLRDVPLPPTSTCREYLLLSARLLGLGRGAAKREVERVLAELELSTLARRRCRELTRGEARALRVAHGALGAPRAIALEEPLAGLGGVQAALVLRTLELAGRGPVLIVSTSVVAPSTPEGELALSMDEALVLHRGSVVAALPPAQLLHGARHYLVRVTHGLAALCTELERRSISARRLAERVAEHPDVRAAEGTVEGKAGGAGVEAGVAVGVDADADSGADIGADGEGRLLVDLGEGAATSALVEAALAAGAPIVELVPLGLERGVRVG